MYDVKNSASYNEVLKTNLLLLLEILIIYVVDYIYLLIIFTANVTRKLPALVFLKYTYEFQNDCYYVSGFFCCTLTFVYHIAVVYNSHVLSILMSSEVNIFLPLVYFFVPSDLKNVL